MYGTVIQQAPQAVVQQPAQAQPVQQVQQPAQAQPAPTQMVYNPQAGGYQNQAVQQAQPMQQVQQVMQPTQQSVIQPVQQAPAPAVGVATTTNAQIDAFFTHAGIPTAQVEQEMQAFGKLTDGTHKALVEKHGEATANLVSQQAVAQHTQSQAAQMDNQKKVFSLLEAGFKDLTQQTGAETWKELDNWTASNLSVDERKSINAQIKQGGLAAELAVGYLVTKYKSTYGVEQAQEAVLDGHTLTAAASTGNDLTISEYNKEMTKLTQAGHQYDSAPAELLKQRREASRKRGVN